MQARIIIIGQMWSFLLYCICLVLHSNFLSAAAATAFSSSGDIDAFAPTGVIRGSVLETLIESALRGTLGNASEASEANTSNYCGVCATRVAKNVARSVIHVIANDTQFFCCDGCLLELEKCAQHLSDKKSYEKAVALIRGLPHHSPQQEEEQEEEETKLFVSREQVIACFNGLYRPDASKRKQEKGKRVAATEGEHTPAATRDVNGGHVGDSMPTYPSLLVPDTLLLATSPD